MRWMQQIFVRNAAIAVNAMKKYFTAFFTKILREIHRISYKNSPHLFSNGYLNSQEIS